MSRRALRAYAFVYSVLALQEGTLPVDAGLAQAVRLLFWPEGAIAAEGVAPLASFPFGEPEESRASCGYSVARDVLWVRTHRFFGQDESRPDGSGMDAVRRLLEDDRHLWPRLQRFVRSPRWRDWQGKDVRARQPLLSAVDEEVYQAIATAHGKTMVAYRGALLVGHNGQDLPGVYVIGARDQAWLVNELEGERLRWLLWPADVVAPLVPRLPTEDLSFCLSGRPSVERFADQPLGLRTMARALLSWHANPTPDPWAWRDQRAELGEASRLEVFRYGARSLRACFFRYGVDEAMVEREVRDVLRELPGSRPPGERVELLVVAALPRAVVERAIGSVLSGEEALARRVRFLVVDGPTLEALACRYPWVWALRRAQLDRQHEAPGPLVAAPMGVVGAALTLVSHGRVVAALATLRSLTALPRAESEDAGGIALGLAQLGKDAPWTMLGDVARALRPEWRHVGSRSRAPDVAHEWWATVLPRLLFEVVPRGAWAPVPAVRTPPWWGFVRLLRGWCSVGGERVALFFVDRLRGALREEGLGTQAVDAAWEVSRPRDPRGATSMVRG